MSVGKHNKDTFKQHHERILLILEKHKEDVINYNTIVFYLNKIFNRKPIRDINDQILRYVLLLFMELYTIRNHLWIKENKILSDIFDESE